MTDYGTFFFGAFLGFFFAFGLILIAILRCGNCPYESCNCRCMTPHLLPMVSDEDNEDEIEAIPSCLSTVY